MVSMLSTGDPVTVLSVVVMVGPPVECAPVYHHQTGTARAEGNKVPMTNPRFPVQARGRDGVGDLAFERAAIFSTIGPMLDLSM